jgi:hypothetical protein
MAIQVWDSTFTKAQTPPIGTLDGGAVSVAIKKNTTPPQVYFKYSPDGSDWSMTPVLVGDLGSSAFKTVGIRQKSEAGSADLVISNGSDKEWASDKMGASGTWTAT